MVDTSLNAWEITKAKLGKIHTRLYDVISRFPDHTTAEYGVMLHILNPTIGGRPGELCRKGLIKRVEKRECAVTKNQAWTWSVK